MKAKTTFLVTCCLLAIMFYSGRANAQGNVNTQDRKNPIPAATASGIDNAKNDATGIVATGNPQLDKANQRKAIEASMKANAAKGPVYYDEAGVPHLAQGFDSASDKEVYAKAKEEYLKKLASLEYERILKEKQTDLISQDQPVGVKIEYKDPGIIKQQILSNDYNDLAPEKKAYVDSNPELFDIVSTDKGFQIQDGKQIMSEKYLQTLPLEKQEYIRSHSETYIIKN